jgi:AcrR family transcriptional regulator
MAEPSLRERKKLDTRRALSDATLQLAFEHGLENITREQIAHRAGVSLRTFSNYFTGKYDALAYRQVERIRRSLDILRERPAEEPLWDAIVASVVAPLESDADDAGHDLLPTSAQLNEVRKLVDAHDARALVSPGVYADWVDVIAHRTGLDPVRDLYPRLAVGVVAAVIDAAMAAYVHAEPPSPITGFLHRGFAEVRSGLTPPKGVA